MNTNLSRYRSQSLQVLLDNAQGDTSQDPRISKLQEREFEICLVRSIEEQVRPIEIWVCRILSSTQQQSNPKRIRVLDLLLLVYKGNSKHVFIKLFRERRVPPLYLGFYTQKALSYFLPVLFLKESQDPVLQKLLPLQSSKMLMI